MKRVVVTGMSAITPIGNDWQSFASNLQQNRSGIIFMDDWQKYHDLYTKLAAPVADFQLPAHYKRKQTRSMGRVAKLAVRATELALEDAALLDSDLLTSGQMGASYGSCTGSPDAMTEFGQLFINHTMSGINSTTYIRLMSHTTVVNIAVFFAIKGRINASSTACTSGSQGIGYAYEMIQSGKQIAMIAGGAEELCATEAAIFDTVYATSQKNQAPHTTPRPFDTQRDGLVVGEGACTLILEEREHALARGAKIYAEIVGFATNCDGGHITQPDSQQMEQCVSLALQDAQLSQGDIGYINAHGTATLTGDVAESQAYARLFGEHRVPVSSLKGNIGHTLGACGAIEAWASIEMMRAGRFTHTLNLETPDPECGDIDYIIGEARAIDTDTVMSNNFAFGGINTSLIFRKHA